MKLHRIILLVILFTIVLLSACSPNDTPPATPLRGAIVPTRVTETPSPTPTLTLTPTFEATEFITPDITPTEEPTATSEPTQEVVLTSEVTEVISTPVSINVVTEEATLTPEPTLTSTPTTIPTETATSTPTETPVIPSETPTPTPTETMVATAIPVSLGDVPIVYGDVMTGTITSENYEARYTFEATEGDLVSILMRATNREEGLDGYLTILAPNGAQLVVNDDLNSLQSYDPGVVNFPIPQTGTYTIIASRFNGVAGTSAGSFELSLTLGDPIVATPTATSTAEISQNAIVYGERAQGEISNDIPYVAYQFVAEAGDVIGIQVNMLSGTLDPQVVLFSVNGAEIASNDDDPQGGFNAYLRDFTIPEAGVYTIWATRFNRETGTSEGQYELILERISGGVVSTPVANTTVLALGDTVQGDITNENFARLYTFSGTQGQIVTFTMRASIGDLDPYLILLDPQGQQIFRNDDGAELGFNSSLDKVRLPMDGDYTVVATRFQQVMGSSQGTFQLTAVEDTGSQQALIPVDEMSLGDSVSDGLNGGSFHYYSFFAEAGDVVAITHSVVSGNLDPFLTIEDSYGVELARSYDDLFDPAEKFDNSAIRDFIIPETGYYVIGVGYGEGTSGQYRVILNKTGTSTEIPQYGWVDWIKTTTFTDGEASNFLVTVGDWVVEEVERRMSSVLIIRLPPSEGKQLARADLNLEVCYLTNARAFSLFGDLEISMLAYYASDVEIQIAEATNPTPFTTVNSCQTVDMTELIQEAYDARATYVQIQLNFASNTINRNGSIDAIIFLDPRLELYFED
ncbi:MAG: pre-peptidase C-terminal domain-containing protein [Anaerolineae bacterium]|nr:pre-peptidase C-terminal domain-containing protein [Anaerolineae bacterium]